MCLLLYGPSVPDYQPVIMRILITNDDGIDAPGIERLVDVASRFGEPVVVAPLRALSGCGHQVTSDGAIAIEQRETSRWAIDGTPADCVRIALSELAADVDWVFSGINAGGNLGVDVFMSGTVAAVREAALLGRPGIAISQYRRTGSTIRGARSAELALQAVESILNQSTPHQSFWNVNLPDPIEPESQPQFIECGICRHPLRMEFESQSAALRYRGDYHDRPRNPGDDVDVCFGGDVAISRLSVWGDSAH